MNNSLRLLVVCVLVAAAILMIALGMARNTNNLLAPLHLLMFVGIVALYILPTALAFYRDCRSTVWIAAVNVLLGWTLFGWVVAIGWAASGKTRSLPDTMATPPRQALQGH